MHQQIQEDITSLDIERIDFNNKDTLKTLLLKLILSYLLDIPIANRLKEADIGVKSTQKVYEVLKNVIIGKITMKSTGDEFLKLMSTQSHHKAILELFQSENVVRRVYLKSMGIK